MLVPRCKEISFKVGGKLNLFLAIVGKTNGYHSIETVFQSIDVYDNLKIEIIGEDVKLTCRGMPSGENNLALKAGRLFKETFGLKEGIHIWLDKRIPIGRGLGGGSADAGGVLLALGRLYGIPRERLLPLASSLGADVSFFLYGGCAIGRGKGDLIEPIPLKVPFRFFLLIPSFSIPTAIAYAQVKPPYQPSSLNHFLEVLRKGDIMEIGKAMRNDLEKAVFPLYPELAEAKEELLEQGFPTLMTGSGSALFALFKDHPPSFSREGWKAMIVNPTSIAVEWR